MHKSNLILYCIFTVCIYSAPIFAEVSSPPNLKKLDNRRLKPKVPEIVDLDELEEARKKKEAGIRTVGKDIEKFGSEVANRIDRIVNRKAFNLWGDPWTVQGIPLIFPSSNNGFHLGLHIRLHDIKRVDPHKLEVQAQALASDEGRYKHFLQVDHPYLFNDLYRLTWRVAYNRDISFRYFGISNNTSVDKSKISGTYYENTRTGPSFGLQFLRYLGKNYRAGPIMGFKWTEISVPVGSLLSIENPIGIRGGRTHYLGFAIVRDTLDFAPNPSSGSLNEIYINWYAPLLGSTYDFLRTTYTFKYYTLLHKKLILAHRTLFEVLSGTVPFYELGGVGGSDSTIGFGGDRFFRGYEGNRFIDQIRFVMGFELRWQAFSWEFAGQDFVFSFAPFVDLGRVWSRLTPIRIGTVHASTGFGVRTIWNNNFVIRGDYAINPEGTAFYVELDHSF